MAFSLNDLSMFFQKKVYEIENNAKGKKLVWDAKQRKYVAHFDSSDSDDKKDNLGKWTKYGNKDGWGNSGW